MIVKWGSSGLLAVEMCHQCKFSYLVFHYNPRWWVSSFKFHFQSPLISYSCGLSILDSKFSIEMESPPDWNAFYKIQCIQITFYLFSLSFNLFYIFYIFYIYPNIALCVRRVLLQKIYISKSLIMVSLSCVCSTTLCCTAQEFDYVIYMLEGNFSIVKLCIVFPFSGLTSLTVIHFTHLMACEAIFILSFFLFIPNENFPFHIIPFPAHSR